MKKVIILGFILFGLQTQAGTSMSSFSDVFSRCCEVTVTDVQTGDTMTSKACRATLDQACDAAYDNVTNGMDNLKKDNDLKAD